MKINYLLPTFLLLTASCSTMSESLQLGASMGALSGAAATYGARSAIGAPTTFESVGLGAGIGVSLGLVAAYITHRQVEDQRQSFQTEQIETHFGDLPPSPFIVPKIMSFKKGVK